MNSIRWRFALASAVLTIVGTVVRDACLGLPRTTLTDLASIAALAASIASITFWMATKLTGQIASLQKSTEALAAGDFDSPVDVDCACEVGGLASSFRKMTTRLNANILRMNALAYMDTITALPNRSVIEHMLAYAMAPERRERFRAAIVFIDLDGFKRINDTLGHYGGDQLLKLASRRILENGLGRTIENIDMCLDRFGNPCDRMPEDIVFARFAGDEFVAILPGVTDRAALSKIGSGIIRSLREPFRVGGQDVNVGASLGIAIAPDDATSATDLLSFADLAMYSSKQSGKSRFMFFDRRIRDDLVERSRIEADLRGALGRDELLLHYQPKVGAVDGRLAGVEALVRWSHPERGLLFPAAFIDIAEHAGLMAQLGNRVIELAARQCRRWLDSGIRRPVAVNVSPSQFSESDFVQVVLEALREHGAPPELVSIEITESMAMADFDTTVRRLEDLRAAGVQIAIDDFGIGFSNLSQLSRLPVDALKIDRSLVSEIGQSGKSEAIIRAILGMTHALGYKTIAEGIETPEQLEFLVGLGCDYAQGYLFGKPMSADHLDRWETQRGEPARPPEAPSLSPPSPTEFDRRLATAG